MFINLCFNDSLFPDERYKFFSSLAFFIYYHNSILKTYLKNYILTIFHSYLFIS